MLTEPHPDTEAVRESCVEIMYACEVLRDGAGEIGRLEAAAVDVLFDRPRFTGNEPK